MLNGMESVDPNRGHRQVVGMTVECDTEVPATKYVTNHRPQGRKVLEPRWTLSSFQQAGNHTNLSEEELRNANPFMMLLRSLLPWVNVGEPGEGEARQPGQPPGGDGEPRPGQ
eukprot:1159589-Pelagomonas_calceolata.AAC.17